jgi:hypothetical protein
MGGTNHDIPLLLARSTLHGLPLPGACETYVSGHAPVNHLDLLRVLMANNKIRSMHMAELAAMHDVPAKPHAHT